MKYALWVAAAIVVSSSANPVSAAAPNVPVEPSSMTMTQLQGLACLGTGALGSLVAYAYTDMLVVVGAIVDPVALFAPVVATGFAFGCSIGATAAPGVFWLNTKLR